MAIFVGLIIFLLSLGGAESFLKHLRSRRIQLRETNRKLSEADVLDLVKTIFTGGAAPVGLGIYTLALINTTNKEKNDKLEKLLVDAQAAATRDMREHQLATANALEKICTATQTANALMVKDIDKLSGKT